ncbi:putative gastrointestinal growth factor xP4 [Erpetoichthys calabaricus]|uniref:Putative gastrointestinal growth factor xP4 n=1 Tax=Erpetoichthys calabaricus TaxID=27687 RepID=A0A8C4T3G5_ERPCA|nr:putative gastrointestinal growth factor xP4 [Erpetoichthys calabaricus]
MYAYVASKMISKLALLLFCGVCSSTIISRLPMECKVSAKERVTCGPNEIGASACKAKGCCFSNALSGVKWCFKPKVVQCSVAPVQRTECEHNIRCERSCLEKGCCFNATTDGIQCHRPEVSSFCSVAPSRRVACGYPGISVTKCNRRGCCFDSRSREAVWCFRPRF